MNRHVRHAKIGVFLGIFLGLFAVVLTGSLNALIYLPGLAFWGALLATVASVLTQLFQQGQTALRRNAMMETKIND